MASSGLSVDAKSLPTLTKLYESGELTVPEHVNAVLENFRGNYEPSAALNDKIVHYRGDITKLKIDAIVNAANSQLMGGGGVDGAIHRAAGPQLLRECRAHGGCPTGEARVTSGYRLPATHVIHTVGPIYDEMDAQESTGLLVNCYNNSLDAAVEKGAKTVAFCAISTGIYGYPSQAAAIQACKTVRKYLEGPKGAEIERVLFVTFEMKDVVSYNNALP